MSATLTVSGLDVVFGARTLLTGLDLVLADGDVTALVGPNGSGKSSLMRTIVGELPIEAGSIRLAPRDASIAWLPQVPPDPHESLLGYARRRTGVEAADVELAVASEALAGDLTGAAARYAAALETWLALGAPDLAERLPEAAARVGLEVDPARPLGTLSGGQAARACLAALLLSRYDVLLLDEPTNNLDARGLEAMAGFVRAHQGPVLVASHDRAFLDLVATEVVELDLHQGRIGHYTGSSYSDFVAARALAREQAWRAYTGYAEQRDALLDQARQRQGWAERGRAAVRRGDEPDKHLRERDKARADRQGAKSARLARAADRLDEVAQPRKEWQLRYTIAEGSPSADLVAGLSGAVVQRGDFRLGPVDLTLTRGDRVALLGDNGSGKSTLLGALIGELPLTAGRHSLGTRVRLGVLDQERTPLETDASLLEVVRPAIGADDDEEPRTLLAKFGLGAEHVHRPAHSLSMGERTRALMAVFSARAVNLLVLDEPTNHLDLAAIEELESAVSAFTGTVVVVSHDRALLEAVGVTRVWRLEAGRLRVEEAGL